MPPEPSESAWTGTLAGRCLLLPWLLGATGFYLIKYSMEFYATNRGAIEALIRSAQER